MTGLISILCVVALIATVVIKMKRSSRVAIQQQQGRWTRTEYGARRQRPSHSEQMIACVKCGLYIPVSEGIYRNGQAYCSKEHSQHVGF